MITSEKELRPAHIQALVQTMPMQDQPSLSRRAGAGCWLVCRGAVRTVYMLL